MLVSGKCVWAFSCIYVVLIMLAESLPVQPVSITLVCLTRELLLLKSIKIEWMWSDIIPFILRNVFEKWIFNQIACDNLSSTHSKCFHLNQWLRGMHVVKPCISVARNLIQKCLIVFLAKIQYVFIRKEPYSMIRIITMHSRHGKNPENEKPVPADVLKIEWKTHWIQKRPNKQKPLTCTHNLL